MAKTAKAATPKPDKRVERAAERLFEDISETQVDRLILAYDLAPEAPHHYGEVLVGGKRVWLRGGLSKESVTRIIEEEMNCKLTRTKGK